MSNIFFTSDWHLDHDNLMKKLYRPYSSLEDMNDAITHMFYDFVRPGDIVYFLGDLSWSKEAALEFLSKKPRNIHIHFIAGNHDKNIRKESIIGKYIDSYSLIKDIKVDEQKITLCHYMMSSWNCSHWNAWHIFGHHHAISGASHSEGKTMSACLDLNNYKMVSFDEVREYMKIRPDNWDLIIK